MGIGIVGKPNGVRMITGSERYGMRTREEFNLLYKEYPTRHKGRQIMILGQSLQKGYQHPKAVTLKRRVK